MNRFPDLDAVREHLRNPTELMTADFKEPAERAAFLKELAENKTLVLSKGGTLVCYKHEGRWYVAGPGVLRHIPCPYIDMGSKAKTLLFAQLLEEGIDMPWDGDDMVQAFRDYRGTHNETLPFAIMRVVAGNPVLDPKGMISDEVTAHDASRAKQERILARETAAGYTERIKVSEIEPGDEISYSYSGKQRYGWDNLGIKAARDWMSLTIRAKVLDEGRLMTRHGNNYDEFMDGLRFKAQDVSWFDDNGDATGTLSLHAIMPTTCWSARVLRKPKAAGK